MPLNSRLPITYRIGRKYRYIKNRHKKPLKVWWWRSSDSSIGLNFGDEITPYIIKSIFNRRVELASTRNCDLIAAGSILQMFQGPEMYKTKVWGSGFIEEGPQNNNKNLEFYAVRGPLSRMRIGDSDLVVGDPGLLANLVFPAAAKKTHRVGIVPHYVDLKNPLLQDLDTTTKIISPLQGPYKVAKEITSCDLVLSSSLHGLIFADSFGIPAYWMPMSNKVRGGDYKFKDYYLSTQRDVQACSSSVLNNPDKIDALISGANKIENLHCIQKKLIKAFPYK